jgi:hypothetical protein
MRSRRPGGAGLGTSTPILGRATLAEAWQVLGDPARRAAYDRALARERQPAVRVAGPPLRAGPVRVERPRPASPAARRDEDIGLAVLADLALRYMVRDRGRPW